MSRAFKSHRRRRGRDLILSMAATLLAGHLLLAWGLLNFSGLSRQKIEDPEYYKLANNLRHRLYATSTGTPTDFESIVFLGNSHFAYGIDGPLIESRLESCRSNGSSNPNSGGPVLCSSMAIFATGPFEQEIVLRRMLQLGIRPRTIVLEFCPFYLAGGPPLGSSKDWLFHSRISDGEIDEYYAAGEFKNEPRWRRSFEWYVRRQTLRGLALQWLLPELAKIEFRGKFPCYDGFYPTPRNAWGTPEYPPYWEQWSPEARIEMALQERKTRFDVLQSLRIGGAAWHHFQTMLDLCDAHGIRPVVLRMPELSIWRSWHSQAVCDDADAKIDEIRRRGVTFIDAWDWLNDGAFSDGHHLRREAASEFSARLCDELGTILFDARPQPLPTNSDGRFRLASRRK